MRRIKNRENLYVFIEEMMEQAFRGRAESKLEYEKGIPKVYILEFFPGLDEKELFDLLTKEIRRVFQRKKLEISFDSNGELMMVKLPDLELYFDPLLFYSDDFVRFRFVPVFTMSRSLESDTNVERLINRSHFIDYEWLNHDRAFKNLEAFRIEVGSEFDGALEDTIVDFNFEFHSSSSEYLSKAIKDMFKYVPVNFTKGKFRITQNDMPLYLYTYSNGKITFYGGDFEMVRGVIKQVTVEYGHEIKRIEEKEKKGEPVLILFSESKRLPSGMTSKFLSKFLSMDNLKLFNVDIFEGSDYAKAIVADFHVGGTLVIKLYSYGMLLTLLNGSCANSVKRIESFLRRSYDPCIEVLVDEEEIIGKLEAFESGEEGIS